MPRATSTFSLDSQPEVFFTTTEISRAVRSLLRAGKLRHIDGRLYTKNLDDPLEEVVRRRAWDVAAGFFPRAVITDRTAFEMQPSGDEGSIFLSATTQRVVRLPGLVLNARHGPGPVTGDQPFMGGALFLSSWPRRFLDNMRPSRARAGTRRTLTRAELEDRLQSIVVNQGEGELNRLRDDARTIAHELDAQAEYERLEGLIGALLGTREAELVSEGARATQRGEGWDDRRLPLFDRMFSALRTRVPVRRSERPGHNGAPFAFFEAYFSNFIEGTEFSVEEAEEIVFRGVIPDERPQDAHDIVGTFDLVSDPAMRSRTPSDPSELETIIRAFHARIMAGRPGVRPGEYKTKPNRAGSTEFVAPALVRGTLRRGYERYAALDPGFPRAVFAMFLVAEVHPFADGNGRVARALANAELTAAGEQRLIVPTVLRDDYLQALRALSRYGEPMPLVRVADRAQTWAHEVDWGSIEAARRDLERTNALLTSAEADERGVVLRLPREIVAA